MADSGFYWKMHLITLKWLHCYLIPHKIEINNYNLQNNIVYLPQFQFNN